MNQFSKEELEQMANWGEVYTEFGQSWADKTERPLIDKIQSMLTIFCKNNDHSYEFSLGRGRCENCGELE